MIPFEIYNQKVAYMYRLHIPNHPNPNGVKQAFLLSRE